MLSARAQLASWVYPTLHPLSSTTYVLINNFSYLVLRQSSCTGFLALLITMS